MHLATLDQLALIYIWVYIGEVSGPGQRPGVALNLLILNQRSAKILLGKIKQDSVFTNLIQTIGV